MPANVSQRLLFRYLQLNRRIERGKKNDTAATLDEAAAPPDDFPPLHDLVERIWTACPTVGERHAPRLEDGKPKNGQRYVVLLRKRVHRNSGAVVLRICVYTGGESQGFAPKDLDAAEGSVSYRQVVDDDGRELDPGVEFSVLLLGRVALIQNRQGTGAAAALRRVIHRCGRDVLGPEFIMPDFLQVSPRSIAEEIEEAGGVTGVSFGVVEVADESGAARGLEDVIGIEHRLGGSKNRVLISASGDATLDAETSLNLLEEQESEGLENVTLHLKDKQTIKGSRMVLSKPVSVPLSNGVPCCDDVDRELLAYLRELMQVGAGGEQAITPEGHIGGRLKIVTFGKVAS